MVLRSQVFKRFLDGWPGKRLLGNYRFLPFFFVLGAALEFSMINWQVGEVNFYHTFKKRKAEEILENIDFASVYPVPEYVLPKYKTSLNSAGGAGTGTSTGSSDSS